MDRNPTLDPPRIPSPEIYSSGTPPSRSQSCSPSRHKRNFSKSHDPLLRNLSPTSTLRAFTAAASATAGKSEDQLVRSIEAASPSERAFGARIVQTCKDIRVWHDEIHDWEWPGTFEEPAEAEKPAKRIYMLDHSPDAAKHTLHPSGDQVQFWGCLPYELVMSCERRVEEIRDALDERDVEDLKNHVLNAHIQPRSPQSAAQSDEVTSSLQRLDDFTALITATILQALPYLSRLFALLGTWSIRLLVLRKVPAFLRELHAMQLEIQACWSAMVTDLESRQEKTNTLRTKFDSTHRELGKRVSRLGARLDSVLDDLEGREETLPDHWIDAFEELEAAYSEWVTHTERELMTRDLNLSRSKKSIEPAHTVDVEPAKATTPVMPYSDQEEIRDTAGVGRRIGLGLTTDSSDDKLGTPATTFPSGQLFTVKDGHGEDTQTPPVEPESPVLGTNNMSMFAVEDDQDISDSDGELSPPADESQARTLGRRSIPSLPEVDLSRSSSAQRHQPLQHSPTPSPARPRHVPILVGYEGKEAVPSFAIPQAGAGDLSIRSVSSPTPALGGMAQGSNPNSVRARAAFLNRGIEQTQTLQKSVNSPVRPFEHASQAFTKLFSRASSAQHSRSNSASSRSSSLRKGLGITGKKDLDPQLERSSSSLPTLQPGKSPEPAYPTGLVELSAEPAVVDASETIESNTKSRTSSSADEVPGNNAFITPETHFGFEPSTRESKSTIESAWNSPAFSDFQQHWPLPSRLNDEEITSPKKPIEATFFERMFVDSLPATPDGPRFDTHVNDPTTSTMQSSVPWAQPHEHTLDNTSPVREQDSSVSKRVMNSKPRHIPIMANGALSGAAAGLSEVTTPASFLSTLSTPEVQSASAAGYFRPKEVRTPPPASRTSSASTMKHNKTHSSQDFQVEDSSQHFPSLEARTTAKRASVASIENFSRSEVLIPDHTCTQNRSELTIDKLKTIDIQDTPRKQSSASNNSAASPSRPSPRSPDHARSDPRQQGQGVDSSPSAASSSLEKGSSVMTVDTSTPPIADISIPKRRRGAGSEKSTAMLSDENFATTAPKKKSQHKRTISEAEQIDRQVSRVLSSLPSRIRFTPAQTSIADAQASPEPSKGNVRVRPELVPKGSRTNLTLTPAQQDEKPKKAKSTDSEVKLYHLSQEGREQPIKLYVRLVGEGERVMVRVGGGWADLGEYLRQYAEHHGRRTISDGRVEVAGATKPGAVSKVRTPLTRPGSVLDRPTSRLSQGRRSSLLASAQQLGGRAVSPAFFAERESSMTPTPPGTASGETSQSHGTPTSISTKSGSRPSTADAALSSSPASWDGADIGLAGPASKKKGKELDQHKARWVEDMIERAKQASVEKKGRDGKTWEGLGRIGGTRRVIFKNQTKEG